MPVHQPRSWLGNVGGPALSMILASCLAQASRAEEAPSIAPAGREELMRRFDINHDGRIDPSEAELGRSKMRRERADAARQSGLDPLTGRPRSQATAGDQRPGEMKKPVLEQPAKPPVAASAPVEGDRSQAARPQSRDANAAAQPLPSQQRPGAATGGIRAGAPGVRPGYGAPGGTGSLNAGRPIPPRTPLLRQPPGGVSPTQARPQLPATTGSSRPAARPQPPISAEEMGR